MASEDTQWQRDSHHDEASTPEVATPEHGLELQKKEYWNASEMPTGLEVATERDHHSHYKPDVKGPIYSTEEPMSDMKQHRRSDRKIILLACFLCFLVIAVAVGVIAGVVVHEKNDKNKA